MDLFLRIRLRLAASGGSAALLALALSGCATSPGYTSSAAVPPRRASESPAPAEKFSRLLTPANSAHSAQSADSNDLGTALESGVARDDSGSPSNGQGREVDSGQSVDQLAAISSSSSDHAAELSIPSIRLTAGTSNAEDPAAAATPLHSTAIESNTDASGQTIMDLGTILSMAGGQHPNVGFARWRVQQALAEQLRADTLWLPSIQAGISYHEHAGHLQASNGQIQDVHRSSLQAGLGTGAVGAGTTMNPGLVARFHVADAIYAPSIAEKNVWAQGHAATAAVNDQLLAASLAWLDLLTAEQRVAVLDESMQRTQQLARLTLDFAQAGQGLQSDADRMTTEVSLARNRLLTAHEQSAVASARLLEAISLRSSQRIVLSEPMLVPVELIDQTHDASVLISQGLRYRPELQEAQCLVAAACEQYQRQKLGPFVPSVLLGVSQTGFGGGQGTTASNFSSRTDFDAALTWEVRGLGYGEQAARRSTVAQVEQARFRQVRLMDQVAREISEAHTQVRYRSERITAAQQGIESAEESARRNLDRIRNGQGLPIEALQSVRALEDVRLALLQAISDYNAAQFGLYRALGHPVYAATGQQNQYFIR